MLLSFLSLKNLLIWLLCLERTNRSIFLIFYNNCSFAPHYIPEKYRPQWLYNELLEIQKAWLDKQAEETVQ